jgi:hypothetical protein
MCNVVSLPCGKRKSIYFDGSYRVRHETNKSMFLMRHEHMMLGHVK